MTNIRHLRALQAFDATASRLNISKAADDLGVTHGAVSRQIKQLEQYLDVQLLRRLPGGVQLTEEGAHLHRFTQESFAALQQGIGSVKRTRPRRSVTVSLSSSLAIKWIVPKLPEFRERHPGISIRLDTDDQIIDFFDSEVDVALRYGGQQSSGLYSERLVNERLVVVAAPSWAEGLVEPKAVVQLPLLHDRFHPHWDRWASKAGLVDPDVQSKSSAFPNSAVLIAAAIDGQGAILVRKVLVADDLNAGRLIYLSDVSIEDDNALCFVCRDGDERSSPISTFRAWLNEIAHRA
ncbi:LysR substrate-binding domain-containing protein [Ruegeria sp. R14_0]|uniref:LysR substrate-binding domain-containing protein n=1 Tax=Ruegeria sp. R14_0 TaxID=2821100 RepID=UPI001ADB32F4|nr:LysR substrate-binding domain-containing protein [Ruegeria sp. R14_0]MBO9446946.1 LysR family transcriptional regulator [Ruegeria sp. R14_0]